MELLSLCVTVNKSDVHHIGHLIRSVMYDIDEVVVGLHNVTLQELTDAFYQAKLSEKETSYYESKIKTKIVNLPYDINQVGFAYMRNKVLAKASGLWILTLDPDERVGIDSNLRQIVILSSDANETTAKLHDRTVVFNKQCGGLMFRIISPHRYLDDTVKLTEGQRICCIKNGEGIEYVHTIHESCYDSIASKNMSVLNVPIKIYHLGYDVSTSAMREKILRNTALTELSVVNDGLYYYNKMTNATLLQDYAMAVQFGKSVLTSNLGGFYKSKTCLVLGNIFLNQIKDMKMAKSYYETGLEISPENQQLKEMFLLVTGQKMPINKTIDNYNLINSRRVAW